MRSSSLQNKNYWQEINFWRCIIGIAVDRSSGAACRYPANIMYPMVKDSETKQQSTDLTSELKKLNELYKSGALSKQEFDQAKAMLLK